MKHGAWKVVVPVLFISLQGAGGLDSPPVMGNDFSVADHLAEAIRNYKELEFDAGIDLAHDLLDRSDIDASDKAAIYAVLSLLTFAKGIDHISKSYGYLEKIAELGPCIIHLPTEFWTQEIRDKWYHIARSRDALSCPQEVAGGENPTRTIAIMEFDNYSTGKYQEELGFITKGLSDFFEADFARISELRVVERDKINFILKELDLAKSGLVDQATAVQVGKLLGAQIMVFGTIVQTDDKKAKMLVKAVKVETSEILTTVESEGKPEYFKMQKKLVMELAEKLDLEISKETKDDLKKSGTNSSEAFSCYSKGLVCMEDYDYKQAYEHFERAYQLDSNFVQAKHKMDIYRPLVSSI